VKKRYAPLTKRQLRKKRKFENIASGKLKFDFCQERRGPLNSKVDRQRSSRLSSNALRAGSSEEGKVKSVRKV